jgi:hypothetical protein
MKKNVIILGGNTNKNIPWINRMQEEYSLDYNVITLFFDNWKDNSDIDFDIELLKLREITDNIDNYNIVAKSAGALAVLMGIGSDVIKPDSIVIMGVPLDFAKHKDIDVLKLFVEAKDKTNILVIQQTNDPQGKAEVVEKLLPKDIIFIEIEGNNHSYDEISNIKQFVDSFINIK